MSLLPNYVNTVAGWCGDLGRLLWGDGVPRNDRALARLSDRVMREVGFPCVNFARYPFGLVAVDCNDCHTYQVDDPEIVLYVKLQYHPRHPYRLTRTVPFTYVPQNAAEFLRRLPEYRSAYAAAPKTHPAWGRFIAVSLDRFHIAHAMRALGLPGGCYVLCDKGYEDHALDPVLPRRRMPFDEYRRHMGGARAIIDARGFGDLTHRTIESLGIGVPLIRPRLDNATRDPLVAGVHYLDCGHKGERLAECVEVVRDDRMRRALVENGLEWFERNCTPEAMRQTFARVLREAGLPA